MKGFIVRLIIRIFGDSLMIRHNLSGVAFGEKETGGRATGKEALITFVPTKLSANRLGKDLVPQKLGGLIDTDVVEVGDLRAFHEANTKSRHRPVHAGISIGRDNWSGTLGAVLKSKENGAFRTLFLTNWHVAVGGRGKIGDKIYQPGGADIVLSQADVIGSVQSFAPISMNSGGWWFFRKYNLADAALIVPTVIADTSYPKVGALTGTVPEKVGLAVQKYGRTTLWTTGKIKYTNATVTIGYDDGNATFRKQVMFDLVSGAGDSGSLIISGRNAVALLFAGSDRITVGTPIRTVFDQLYLTEVNFGV